MKKIFLALFIFAGIYSSWGEWNKLEIRPGESLWASSSLSEKLGGKTVVYSPENLFDSDTSTAWVEGAAGYGRGESVLIMTNKIISGFSLVNGYAKSERLYTINSRVKALDVSFVCGLNAPGLVTELDYYLYFTKETMLREALPVKDVMEKQVFTLYDTEEMQDEIIGRTLDEFYSDYPDLFEMILEELGIQPKDYKALPNMLLIMEMYGFTGLKITVSDVYPGTKYDDTCVSEIGVVF